MLKTGKVSCVVFVLLLLIGTNISVADAGSLDGTVWMFEHASGARHYIAFYKDYHYLNSTSIGQEQPDSLWLRSIFPYLSNTNPDGSLKYSATHISPTAWAINWGNCDIDDEQASFNAFGMLYNIFIYNRNEPYILLSTDWSPLLPYSSNAYEMDDSFVEMLSSSILGADF
jgi:hypothetical protein